MNVFWLYPLMRPVGCEPRAGVSEQIFVRKTQVFAVGNKVPVAIPCIWLGKPERALDVETAKSDAKPRSEIWNNCPIERWLDQLHRA